MNRHRLLFLILKSIILLIPYGSNIYAQNFNSSIEFGLNKSKIIGANQTVPIPLFSFEAGGGITHKIANYFFIRQGIRYINKGSKYEYLLDYSKFKKSKISNHYIELPFAIAYEIKDKIILSTGFYWGIFFYSQLTEVTVNPDQSFTKEKFNIQNFYRNYDLGVNVSAFMKINRKISLGAKYSFGIVNIYKYNQEFGSRFNETVSIIIMYNLKSTFP